MIRGCGGTLSLVVHAFGPSFRTIPPRASHYSTRETLSFGLPIQPFQSTDRCQVQFKSFSSVCSPTTSPGTLINELSNNLTSSRIPYRLTFTFNLTVRKSSRCILAIAPHPCSSFFLRFKRLDSRFERLRRLPSNARRAQALQRIFLK